MKLFNENLKKADYFSAGLIAVTIILRLVELRSINIYAKIDAIMCVISLLFGIIYILNGHSKNVAKDYKMFMLFYAISTLFAVMVPSLDLVNGRSGLPLYAAIVIDLATSICAFVLAFGKDLGHKKSILFVLVALFVSVIKLFINTIDLDLSHSIPTIAHLMQAIIAYLFVSAKYEDKEARGTK